MDKLPEVVKVPCGVKSDYLTPRKEYDVIDVKMHIDDDCLFVIKSDDGELIDCKLNSCGHLQGKDWIVVPDGVCLQTCESCEGEFDIESMTADDDSNWFCIECWTELAPVMQAEYEQLKAEGLIDDED